MRSPRGKRKSMWGQKLSISLAKGTNITKSGRDNSQMMVGLSQYIVTYNIAKRKEKKKKTLNMPNIKNT